MDFAITPSAEVKYLGHLPDGSGVQAHSAGEHYPYVIAVVDLTPVDDGQPMRWYEVTGPGLQAGGLAFWTDKDATVAARRLKTCGENEDAWSFEIERAGRLGDLILERVFDYVRDRVPNLLFSQMTPGQRISALLLWGHARVICGPKGPAVAGSRPSFCEEIARAEVRAVDPVYACRRGDV